MKRSHVFRVVKPSGSPEPDAGGFEQSPNLSGKKASNSAPNRMLEQSRPWGGGEAGGAAGRTLACASGPYNLTSMPSSLALSGVRIAMSLGAAVVAHSTA